MTIVKTDSTHYPAIASAIRTRAGTQATMTPAQMPAAIAAIPSGGDVFGEIVQRTIPSLNRNDVVTVGDYAFAYCDQLETVNLPACATVGGSAFDHCLALENVNLPVCTTTGTYAFKDCTALETLRLPAATTLGGYFLAGATALEKLALEALTSLKIGVFGSTTAYANTALTHLYMPALTAMPSASYMPMSDAFRSLCFRDVSAITSSFNNAKVANLSELVFLNSTLVTLSRSSNLTGTYIKNALIYVLDSLVSDYKAAAQWSAIADRIHGVSELPADSKAWYGIS